MRLLPRRAGTDAATETTTVTEEIRPESKGRPTPKRRDSSPRRGPASPAPKTRREALQRQRELSKQARTSGRSGTGRAATGGSGAGGAFTARDRRARIMAGDEAYLPRRDQGPLRAFARDYVDSRRMVSNYLLLLFPVAILSEFVKFLLTVEVTLVLLVFLEGLFTGRRIMAMARDRGIEKGRDRATSIAIYSVMRAYFPRRWRMPRARVAINEKI